MHNSRLVLSMVSGLGVLLVACSGGGDNAEPVVRSSAEVATPVDTNPVTTTAPTTALPGTPESPSGTVEEPVGDVLADLTAVDPAPFHGQDPGSLAGYRFVSPTGNINCHIATIPAACHVREHAPWPDVERRADGISAAGSSTVGWMGEMDLTGRPMHWRQQGTFPVTGVGNPLEYGQKITMSRTIEGVSSQLTCGSRFSGMTCIINEGEHGFTVSRENYESW